MSNRIVSAEFPAKLDCLFQPKRYKILYGGRGAAKSWGVARALLILGAQKPIRVLCAREIQKSIQDSVHQLLRDQISAIGLGGHYQALNTEIRGINGTQFVFAGLKHNVDSIKSKEGIDIVWVEEAQAVSKTSWETLIPTIRKDGSEIWVTFNPELETDETYQRFVIKPPTDAIVLKIGWQDNPWFPDVLKRERDDLKARDIDAYLNIWEGHCRLALEGAVYATELRDATEAKRICSVPYDASKPVDTFWDLGWSDATSIWFAQAIGFEYRIIDYFQDSQRPLQHYLSKLQAKGYVYGTDWLPHDAQAKQLAAGGRSIMDQMKSQGRTVQIVPDLEIHDGINAARTIFGQCWFDQDKCADGLQALRHYRYEVDVEKDTLKRKPLHDWASHGADAFRYLAVSIKSGHKQTRRARDGYQGAGGWLG